MVVGVGRRHGGDRGGIRGFTMAEQKVNRGLENRRRVTTYDNIREKSRSCQHHGHMGLLHSKVITISILSSVVSSV